MLLPTGPGQARTLAPGLERYDWGLFLPGDGSRILLAAKGKDLRARLFVQDLEGGSPRPVVPKA